MAHTLGPNLLQLLKLCLAAAALVHYVACFFYVGSMLQFHLHAGLLSSLQGQMRVRCVTEG